MRLFDRRHLPVLRPAATGLAFALLTGPAGAAEATAPTMSDVAAYCAGIVDAAADARVALQMQTLEGLRQDVEQRIADLEAKRAEVEGWLARREAFAAKAEANIVDIYARMRPDAAAAQLVAMDDETAAAVLAKLNPRAASAILNEMDARKAAALTHVMAGQSAADLAEESL